MGHYASEMMCDKCGKTCCECEPPAPDRSYWLVDNDFTVVTTEEFLSKHQREHHRFVSLMIKKHFRTRRAAELVARKECEEAVEEARKRLLHLKNVCKVQRPWEKK